MPEILCEVDTLICKSSNKDNAIKEIMSIITPNNRDAILKYLLNSQSKIFKKMYIMNLISIADIFGYILENPDLLDKLDNEIASNPEFLARFKSNFRTISKNLSSYAVLKEYENLIINDLDLFFAYVEEVEQSSYYEDLSLRMQSSLLIKHNCQKQMYMYDYINYEKNWFDDKGNLKCFFKFNDGTSPKTIGEYIEIYKSYLLSDSLGSLFCFLNNIANSYEFDEFLAFISKNHLCDRTLINNHDKKVYDKEIAKAKIDAKKILSGEISFDEYIKNNVTGRIDILSSVLTEPEMKKLTLIIFEYVDNIFKASKDGNVFIDANFIGFLWRDDLKFNTGYQILLREIESMNNPELTSTFKNYFVGYILNHRNVFNKNHLYSAYSVNGVDYPVTDEVVDKAYDYLISNGYYVCDLSMKNACKMFAINLKR